MLTRGSSSASQPPGFEPESRCDSQKARFESESPVSKAPTGQRPPAQGRENELPWEIVGRNSQTATRRFAAGERGQKGRGTGIDGKIGEGRSCWLFFHDLVKILLDDQIPRMCAAPLRDSINLSYSGSRGSA